jgi:pyruvate formate lyase activating enzyme
LEFARYLDEKQIPVWVRHVLIPGVTDGEAHLANLGKIIAGLSNVKALDVLPYHTMGVSKYQQLNLPYPLEGIEPATKAQVADARKIILESYRKNRT